MNPYYNNRTFYISKNIDFEKLFKAIAFDGAYIHGVKEFVNTRIVIPNVNTKASGFEYKKLEYVEQLMKAIREQDGDMINDVYDSKYYLFLKDEIEKAKEQFVKDCAYTRRAVFAFPAIHCFDSIQVLIRDGEVITTVNMRSCNAYKNLICDLYLAYRLSCEVTREYEKNANTSLVVNIGSLHIFKEDLNNVF